MEKLHPDSRCLEKRFQEITETSHQTHSSAESAEWWSSICPMAEKSTAKKARQPYDSMTPHQMKITDQCVRASVQVIPGINNRVEDPQS